MNEIGSYACNTTPSFSSVFLLFAHRLVFLLFVHSSVWRVSAHPSLFQLLGHPTYTHDPPVRKPVAKVDTKAGAEHARVKTPAEA
uniref:Uncharacterized protein n=1 Tax=Picea sitchensis TaxID=3332 RepID=A0A6B9XSF4_PICSI|nr:hypothetical protein Q903MT_gene3960 [Picea sitchensis]